MVVINNNEWIENAFITMFMYKNIMGIVWNNQ